MTFITTDAIKTIFQGALGGMSFGVYHQFTTNQIMDLNNKIMYLQIKEIKESNDKLIENNKKLIEYNNQLKDDVNKLKNRRYLWF
jgi:FtsZ-binding cell division protein ZapB